MIKTQKVTSRGKPFPREATRACAKVLRLKREQKALITERRAE